MSWTCKCGRELVVPYPSMQKRVMTAPSREEVSQVNHALTQEIIFHQNRECPWMYMQRKEAELSTKIPDIVLEKNQKLI